MYYDPVPQYSPFQIKGTHTYEQHCLLDADPEVGANALALVEFNDHKYSDDRRNGGPNIGTTVAPQYAEEIFGNAHGDTIQFATAVNPRTKAMVKVWVQGKKSWAATGIASASTVSLAMTNPAPAP